MASESILGGSQDHLEMAEDGETTGKGGWVSPGVS